MLSNHGFSEIAEQLCIIDHIHFVVARDSQRDFRKDIHVLFPVIAQVDIRRDDRRAGFHSKNRRPYRCGCWFSEEINKTTFHFCVLVDQ
jgi:hypothetical protein